MGNHTVNHPSMPDKSNEILISELNELDEKFNRLTGQHMHFMRPPKGEFSERTLALTQKEEDYDNLLKNYKIKNLIAILL